VKTAQVHITAAKDAASALAPLSALAPDLVLAFGDVAIIAAPAFAEALAAAFPRAVVAGCSTAGEIDSQGVGDGGCVVTAVRFASGHVRAVRTKLADMADSRAAGERLAAQVSRDALVGVLVFGQGVRINGSALVEGLAAGLPAGLPITGGLAGDGGAFQHTWVLDGAAATDDGIVALGLYGASLRLAHGSFGGWQVFGPARKVTRACGNVLIELDGEPALDVYKRYLGDHARDLPASGLLFPFAMLGEDHAATGLIRTILAVDATEGSLTLAGEIVEGGFLKLMHASTDALVNGAESAAEAASAMPGAPGEGLALLVSCVGRKLVMGGRVDEEVEAVGAVLGQGATLAGFYSYGEISPFSPSPDCKLHNQTMTITWLGEAA